MEIVADSIKKTKEFAKEIAKRIKPGDVIALYGDLGSGKTTFTGFLVKALGIDARIQSPTFVLMRHYIGNNLTVNHIDLYRLGSKEEILDLGLKEIFEEKNNISIVEWPEMVEEMLPQNSIKIRFFYEKDDSRRIIAEL